MKHSTALLVATLAFAAAGPLSAQAGVAGSWIMDFPIGLRVINGVESSTGTGQARMTLTVTGDSVHGTWRDITRGTTQPARPRTLLGTIAKGRVRVETDPPDEGVIRDAEGEQHVRMRRIYDFTARGDSLLGTEQSINADDGTVAHSRAFSARREATR